MANQTITQLPTAQALTGTELVPIVQDGGTVKTTVAAIAATPALTTYSFVTATSEGTLTQSRRFTTSGGGLTLTDNGAGSTLSLALSGAAASLVAAGTGIQVKTSATTLTARSIAAGTAGLSVSDGNGVAGNPTISLSGMPLYLAQSSGVGLLTRTSGNSVGIVTLQGTANEIDVSNGTGNAGDPTVGLADNPTVPGTAGMLVPVGTTGQRSGSPSNGIIRYNSTTQTFEGYANSAWRDFALTGGVTSFSAGTTGLTPGVATTGAITLNGILVGANGGTGVANTGKTITLGGSLTLSGAHDLTLTQTGATNVTLPTTGTLATLAGSETLTNKTINGSNNTLSNIGNASLTNSSITINGSSVSLGGSVTVTATASNALTIGTGLSGTSYNGSTPVTIAISNTGVSAASYGTASAVPTIAVNAQGQITSATDTAIAIAASQVTSGTLAIARGGTNGSATPTAGAVPYGSGTAYAFSAAGNASEVLLSGGTGSPTWAAQSSLSVGTATNAVNIGITDDTSTNATMYPVWVTANTGNLPAKVTSTKLSFNPSTGILTATGGVAGGTF
jgi:hypothetical protein